MADSTDSEAVKEAKSKLATCRKDIERTKPNTEDHPSGYRRLKPSSTEDLKLIKCYETMNNDVKRDFKGPQGHEYLATEPILTLSTEGTKAMYALHNSAELGKYWHNLLKSVLESRLKKKDVIKENREEADVKLAGELLDKLEQKLNITFMDCEFPLHGFMMNRKNYTVYRWSGFADAICYHKELKKYVIVDWKVKDLLNFWKSGETYGCYLHQSLVYARLLQLHMDLDYLPPILLVPISHSNGRDIQPGLFKDYPEKCKDKIEEYFWSKECPKSKMEIIESKFPFIALLKDVDKEMLLSTFFADKEVTVQDLMDTFQYLVSISEEKQQPTRYEQLAVEIDKEGLKFRQPTPGDGNCMFHAVSDQLNRPVQTHAQLRSGVVEYLRQNPTTSDGTHRSAFLDSDRVVDRDWKAYLKRMSKDKEWGDGIVVQGLADLLQMEIAIVSSIGESGLRIISPQNSNGPIKKEVDAKMILLGHEAEQHYHSLELKTDDTATEKQHIEETENEEEDSESNDGDFLSNGAEDDDDKEENDDDKEDDDDDKEDDVEKKKLNEIIAWLYM